MSFRAQKATFISCVKSFLGILNVSSFGLGGVNLTKIKQVKLLAPTLFEVTALRFLLKLCPLHEISAVHMRLIDFKIVFCRSAEKP